VTEWLSVTPPQPRPHLPVPVRFSVPWIGTRRPPGLNRHNSSSPVSKKDCDAGITKIFKHFLVRLTFTKFDSKLRVRFRFSIPGTGALRDLELGPALAGSPFPSADMSAHSQKGRPPHVGRLTSLFGCSKELLPSSPLLAYRFQRRNDTL
jgi:hypothetical protein